jgi:uncharacterized delta-60 repeat protein
LKKNDIFVPLFINKINNTMQKKHFYFSLFLFFYFLITVKAQTFDTAFGKNGITTEKNLKAVSDVAIQSDGKYVIVGGQQGASYTQEFAIGRFNADGTLDKAFGKDGIASIPNVEGKGGIANAVALQADGKIVVVGRIGLLWAVARYNTNGTLDESFAVGGIYYSTPNAKLFSGEDVIIQEDGKIVVFGEQITTQRNYASMRLLANGTLDKTFGKKGISIIEHSSQGSYAMDAVILADGSFMVLGGFSKNSYGVFALFKVDKNGKADWGFATEGVYRSTISNNNSEPTKLMLLPDGKFLVLANASLDPKHSDFTFQRFLSDGKEDISFGNKGVAYLDFNQMRETPDDFTVLNDGKIIFLGHSFMGKFYEGCIGKCDIDGKIDTSFGKDGQLLKILPPDMFLGTVIKSLPDGGFMLIGNLISDNDTRIILAKMK